MTAQRTTNKLIAAALTLTLVLGLFVGAPLSVSAATDEYGGSVTEGGGDGAPGEGGGDSETAAFGQEGAPGQEGEPGDDPSGLEGAEGPSEGADPSGIEGDEPAMEGDEFREADSKELQRRSEGDGEGESGGIEPFAVKTVGDASAFSAALAAALSGDTIRLTKDINTDRLSVAGKSITIDLNKKFNLTVETATNHALTIGSGGEVKLAGEVPGKAEFNVATTDAGYSGVFVAAGGKGAVVTNAAGDKCGVEVSGAGSSVKVSGDATATGAGTNTFGVWAGSGAYVKVGGDAVGGNYGVWANGEDTSVIVGGDARSASTGAYGAYAADGASVTVGGNATSDFYGAYISDTATAKRSSSITVGGDVIGVRHGVYIDNKAPALSSASIKIGGDAKATDASSNGVTAYGNSSVTVGGDAVGVQRGVYAYGPGPSVKVSGDAYGTGTGSSGVYALSAAAITVCGDAAGVSHGAFTTGQGSFINVDGSARGTGASSRGAQAETGASVTVGGDAIGRFFGAQAETGASIIVRGDVVSGSTGVYCETTSTAVVTTVTVDGTIITNGFYVRVSSYNRDKSQAETVSSKEGYIEYSDSVRNCFIWVREKPASPPALSLTPSHAILTKTGDSAAFTAKLGTDDADRGKFKWKVTYENGDEVPSSFLDISPTTGTYYNTFIINLRTPAMAEDPQTWIVTAIYDEKYTATATVEVMPDGLKPGGPSVADRTTVKLLESKATVNTAKVRGALVPVLITNKDAASLGALAAGDGSVSAMETAWTGADLDASIELCTKDSKGNLVPVPQSRMTAKWYMADARYIEINASKGAKSLKNVYVRIVPNSVPGEIVAVGKLDITITEKYPKIVLKTGGSLNMAFPDDTISLTATSNAGKCVVLSAAPKDKKNKDRIAFTEDGKLKFGSAKKAKGMVSMSVQVQVEGYKTPYKNAPTVSVKILDAAPKIKLSKTTLVLAGGPVWTGYRAGVYIQSNDKKVKTADVLSRITDVTFEGSKKNGVPYNSLDNSFEEYSSDTGMLLLCRYLYAESGKGHVVVTFDSGCVVKLPLTVTMRDSKNLTVSSKKKAVTVHLGHESDALHNGAIIDTPVTVNADNVIAGDWEIKSVVEAGKKKAYNAHDYKGAFKASSPGFDNNMTLSVDDSAKFVNWFLDNNPKRENKKIDLYIGSDRVGKEFKITVTMTDGVASGKLKASNSGRINVAVPNATVTVTLTLKNTSSHIKKVDWPGGNDFKLATDPDKTGKNSFKVELKPGRADNIKMGAQTIKPEITLENGYVFSPTLKLTPVFSKSKAKQSAKSVTIYKGTPQTGADVGLSITTPKGAELGAVAVNQASVDKLNLGRAVPGGYAKDVFEVTRRGEGAYTLRLTDKTKPPVQLVASGTQKGTPVMSNGAPKYAASKSYTVQIELWAKGTYLTDPAGNPVDKNGALVSVSGGKLVPLKNANGAVKTKPTLVTVKVSLK